MAMQKVNKDSGDFFYLWKERWMSWDDWTAFCDAWKKIVPIKDRIWMDEEKQWAINNAHWQKVGLLHRQHFHHESYDMFDD